MTAHQNFCDVEMNLDSATLSTRKNVVRRFYKELWDKPDLTLIPQFFHDDFTFRGSLGPVLVGHAQFGEYVTWLTGTLKNYTSDIFELVEEGNQVCGKLRFRGLHDKPFFGFNPTGRHVWWHGAPIFRFDGDKIRDLWVLGDIYGLVSRMAGDSEKIEFKVD